MMTKNRAWLTALSERLEEHGYLLYNYGAWADIFREVSPPPRRSGNPLGRYEALNGTPGKFYQSVYSFHANIPPFQLAAPDCLDRFLKLLSDRPTQDSLYVGINDVASDGSIASEAALLLKLLHVHIKVIDKEIAWHVLSFDHLDPKRWPAITLEMFHQALDKSLIRPLSSSFSLRPPAKLYRITPYGMRRAQDIGHSLYSGYANGCNMIEMLKSLGLA